MEDQSSYRFNLLCVRTQVRLVQIFIYHVRQTRAKIRVLEPTIFELQFETGIDTQEQSIFPAYNNMSMNHNRNTTDQSYESDSGKSMVFFPGCGHAGQGTAILPSGSDSTVAE
jgi:hypothetical protein